MQHISVTKRNIKSVTCFYRQTWHEGCDLFLSLNATWRTQHVAIVKHNIKGATCFYRQTKWFDLNDVALHHKNYSKNHVIQCMIQFGGWNFIHPRWPLKNAKFGCRKNVNGSHKIWEKKTKTTQCGKKKPERIWQHHRAQQMRLFNPCRVSAGFTHHRLKSCDFCCFKWSGL